MSISITPVVEHQFSQSCCGRESFKEKSQLLFSQAAVEFHLLQVDQRPKVENLFAPRWQTRQLVQGNLFQGGVALVDGLHESLQLGKGDSAADLHLNQLCEG